MLVHFVKNLFFTGTFLVQHVEEKHKPLKSFIVKNEIVIKKDAEVIQDASINSTL